MASNFIVLLFVLGVLSAFLISSHAEDTKVSPEDEDDSNQIGYTSEILQQFLETLKKKSGLADKDYSWSIDLTKCAEKTKCRVNYHGDLVWEARADLYTAHMMQSKDTPEENKITLDGCLNFSTTVADYQSCMKTVRTSMVTYLEEKFDQYIQEKIDADCTLYENNCYVAS